LIPYFDEIKALAIDAGARTGGISGSGPSTFWVCPDERHLHLVRDAVSRFMDQQSVPFHLFQSNISAQGAHVIR
jgi:homoserine kinase